MKPEAIRQWEDALYHSAVDPLPRAADGSYDERMAIEAIACRIEINIERERERRAEKILKDRSRPENTEPGGLLVFMGDRYAYEPERLLRYGEGRVVENERAILEAKITIAERERENAERATRWANRGQREAQHFTRWAFREKDKGRPALELTWGNCIRETGLLT